jgi:hypothetical protein
VRRGGGGDDRSALRELATLERPSLLNSEQFLYRHFVSLAGQGKPLDLGLCLLLPLSGLQQH